MDCLNFQNDFDKIAYFSDFLEGEAAIWFASLARSGIRNSTFDEFLVCFNRTYYNRKSIDDVMLRMFSCSQKSTLSAYNQEYTKLAAAIPSAHFDERNRVNKYIHGLKPELQKMVWSVQPETLEEAMNTALNIAETPYSYKQTARASTLPYGTASCERMDVDVVHMESTKADPIYTGPKSSRRLKLSPQERQLLMKLGICFKCRAGQHKANQCPNASSA